MAHYLLISLTVLFLNFIGEITLMWNCIDERPKQIHLLLIRAVKLLGINLFYDLILPVLLPQVMIIRYAKVWVDSITLIIAVLLSKLVLKFSWGKLGMMYLVADVRAFACTLLPVYVLAVFQHLPVTELMKKITMVDYTICTVATVLCLAVSRRLLARFCEWIRTREPRFGFTWACAFFLYSFCQLFLSVSGVRSAQGKVSYSVAWTAFLVLMGLFFYVFMSAREKQYLRMKAENLAMQNKMIEEYQDSLKAQMELTRKYRHDIENHMQTITRMLEADSNQHEEVVQYVEKLREQEKNLTRLVYCDYLAIDATVANKVARCQREQIRTDVEFGAFDLGHIQEVDFISILFNLFDNAIECCEKQTQDELKYVRIRCHTQQGQIILIAENGCDYYDGDTEIYHTSVEYARAEKELFSFLNTSKETDKIHGVGLRIVSALVKRYNGDMDVFCKNDVFTVRVNMPIM